MQGQGFEEPLLVPAAAAAMRPGSLEAEADHTGSNRLPRSCEQRQSLSRAVAVRLLDLLLD